MDPAQRRPAQQQGSALVQADLPLFAPLPGAGGDAGYPALLRPVVRPTLHLCTELQQLYHAAMAPLPADALAAAAAARRQEEEQQAEGIGSPPAADDASPGSPGGGWQGTGGMDDEGPARLATVPTPPVAPGAGAQNATQLTLPGSAPQALEERDDYGGGDMAYPEEHATGRDGFFATKENQPPGGWAGAAGYGDATPATPAVGFTARTQQVLSRLQTLLPDAAANGAEGSSKRRKGSTGQAATSVGKGPANRTSLLQLTQGQSRLSAARTLFELLVLSNTGHVHLEQERPATSGRGKAAAAEPADVVVALV